MGTTRTKLYIPLQAELATLEKALGNPAHIAILQELLTSIDLAQSTPST